MARKLYTGKGISRMLEVCKQNGWSEDNTDLVIENSGDLNSRWHIYEKVKKGEKK